jgi:hypothetical protein
MKKLILCKEDITDNFISRQSESFSTLDGYVYDDLTGSFSYDNDFDETLPILLNGIKNPNQEERKNSHQKTFYLPKKLQSKKFKNIQFWNQGENHLSEILSLYPQVSASIKGIGKRKANDLFSFLVFLVFRKISILELPLGEDIRETLTKRCKGNNYQGDWSKLSKLLQIENNSYFAKLWIQENFNEREIKGNFLPKGENLFNSLNVSLSAYPVQSKVRKRGYKDKGSRKDPSKIHELSINSNLKIIETRKLEPLTGKEAFVNYLYGITNPAIIVTGEAPSEIEYRKKINKQRNQVQRQELKRIKLLTSKVISYNINSKNDK